jgi:hypothetical protein
MEKDKIITIAVSLLMLIGLITVSTLYGWFQETIYEETKTVDSDLMNFNLELNPDHDLYKMIITLESVKGRGSVRTKLISPSGKEYDQIFSIGSGGARIRNSKTMKKNAFIDNIEYEEGTFNFEVKIISVTVQDVNIKIKES